MEIVARCEHGGRNKLLFYDVFIFSSRGEVRGAGSARARWAGKSSCRRIPLWGLFEGGRVYGFSLVQACNGLGKGEGEKGRGKGEG